MSEEIKDTVWLMVLDAYNKQVEANLNYTNYFGHNKKEPDRNPALEAFYDFLSERNPEYSGNLMRSMGALRKAGTLRDESDLEDIKCDLAAYNLTKPAFVIVAEKELKARGAAIKSFTSRSVAYKTEYAKTLTESVKANSINNATAASYLEDIFTQTRSEIAASVKKISELTGHNFDDAFREGKLTRSESDLYELFFDAEVKCSQGINCMWDIVHLIRAYIEANERIEIIRDNIDKVNNKPVKNEEDDPFFGGLLVVANSYRAFNRRYFKFMTWDEYSSCFDLSNENPVFPKIINRSGAKFCYFLSMINDIKLPRGKVNPAIAQSRFNLKGFKTRHRDPSDETIREVAKIFKT